MPNTTTDEAGQGERTRARQLGAAAAAWRRGNGGACPTVKNILDAYAFPSGIELDATGAPFTVVCFDAEIRVVGGGGVVVDAEPYSAVVASVPRDPFPRAPPDGAPESSVDRAMRATFSPLLRACYANALKRDPDLSGVIHGAVVLRPDGSVKEVVIDKARSTILDAAFLDCIRDRAKGMTFDAPGAAGGSLPF